MLGFFYLGFFLTSARIVILLKLQTAEHLAVLCVNICRVVDPDVIVFSGGLAKAGDVLLQLIRARIDSRAWTILPTDVKLLTAQSIEFGGVVGAALAAKMLLVKQQALQKAAEEAKAQSIAAGRYIFHYISLSLTWHGIPYRQM